MQIIVDELHLLLRINDVLIKNIVTAAATATADARINKDETKQTEKLIESIRECGITFRVCTIHINYIIINSQIWHSKIATVDISPRSGQKKKLLKLPPFIPEIVPDDIGEDIQWLWKVQCIQ